MLDGLLRPEWGELLKACVQFLQAYLTETILVVGVTVLFAFWHWGRDWKALKERRFPHLQFSLNKMEVNEAGNRVLAVRTELELDPIEVFRNHEAVSVILRAARRATRDDPILPIPEKHRWSIMNAVLNRFAEHRSEGDIDEDMGLPVRRARYLLCLVMEHPGSLRTHKMRVMVVRRELLESGALETLDVEWPRHTTRINTLRKLRERLETDPTFFAEVRITRKAPSAS